MQGEPTQKENKTLTPTCTQEAVASLCSSKETAELGEGDVSITCHVTMDVHYLCSHQGFASLAHLVLQIQRALISGSVGVEE